jgi:PAS domain S-box-containing protein
VEDVTAQVRAEEALQESEKKFRNIIESIPMGMHMYELEPDGRLVFTGANPAADEILGVDNTQFVGQTIEEAFPALTETEVPEQYRLVASTGEPWQIDQIIYEENQIAGAFEVHAFQTSPGKMVAAFLDITERKRAEEALKNAEWEKETILDSQLEHVVYQDREHRILWPNQAACDSVGMAREELIGRHCYEVWAQRSERCEDCPVALAMETNQPQEIEKMTPDGKAWFIRGYPVQDVNGEVVSCIEVTQDITERLRAEAEIRKLNEELEGRVIERTAQLEAANKELEAFAYSVSHDLRAPLRGIDGFSQVLLEDYVDGLDAVGQGYLRRVRATSQRMAQLIDDLLKLSRVTRREMRCTKVDLSALARAVAAELQGAQPERQVQFAIAEGLVAEGDEGLLRVVLENLLGNAWKFTSKHPRARIEFGVTQVEGQPAYFVRDDGAGFDIAYADKLFGAFQRLHATEEFEGTGVGLATVQRIIHRHGGRVWAEAEVDKGATFYFTLQGCAQDLKPGAKCRLASTGPSPKI